MAKSASPGVQIEDNLVTITQGGRYELTGQGTGVEVVVAEAVSDDVTLALNDAHLASIAFQSSGTNVLNLADNTENVISQSDVGISATNITINGQGSLTMTDIGQYGVFAEDDLVVESGILNITSSGSGLYALHESDAEHANITINGGDITISASEIEGTAAFLAGNNLIVNSGNISVESAYEAYVGKHITINGGQSNLTTLDDGIVSKDPFYEEGQVSDVDVTIKGGEMTILAQGDALDSNGELVLAGGSLLLTSVNPENGALDFEGTATLIGGTIWALGHGDPLQDFSSAKQVFLKADLYAAARDTVTISDASGNSIATLEANGEFLNLFFSSADLVQGQLYTIKTSGGQYAESYATNKR
ncbi:carbohydrate-binding domain-containing protein [Streptococcus sp. X13SY08]|nr:carbohydrate-binding domain-containing protein [Streptococcus sp. X13SY08]